MTIAARHADIATQDIVCDNGMPAFLAYPAGGGPFPTVILMHERYGLVKHTRDQAMRSARDGFAVLATLIGMCMLVFGWGYRFPMSWLQGTPFADYTVPGLILGLVVGGSALVAMVATIKSVSVGAIASMIAGVIMMGWIVGEYLLIPEIRFFSNLATNWQQGLYFLVGLVMVVLALRVIPGGWHGMLHAAHLA